MSARVLLGHELVGEADYGGLGRVDRAREQGTEREIAILTLPEAVTGDAARMQRLRDACERSASLRHPHIATNLGLREEAGRQHLVLEYHAGVRLIDVLAKGPLPPARAVHVATQVAEALARGHDRGLIHAELRPANVLLERDDRVCVIDLGLSALVDVVKVTDALAPLEARTPSEIARWAPFLSPEQAGGQPVDDRSEVFSLGALLWTALTGEPPFQKPSGTETFSALLSAEPPRLPRLAGLAPELYERLQDILDRCLSRDPEQRYFMLRAARVFKDRPSEDRGLVEDLHDLRLELNRPPEKAERGCLGRAAGLALLAGATALLALAGVA